MQQRHSGLGIASFILSLAGGVLMFLFIVLAGYVEMTTPGGLDVDGPTTVMIGLAVLGAALMEVVALALGIGGVLQHDRRKVFSILGLVFAAGTLLGTAGLMVLGAVS